MGSVKLKDKCRIYLSVLVVLMERMYVKMYHNNGQKSFKDAVVYFLTKVEV